MSKHLKRSADIDTGCINWLWTIDLKVYKSINLTHFNMMCQTLARGVDI